MVRLIATMGASPGAPYETLLNVCRGSYDAPHAPPIRIREVVVVRTSGVDVRYAYWLFKLLILCNRFLPEAKRLDCVVERIFDVEVDVEDVVSREDYEKYRDAIERNIGEGDIVDVTGGRVSMAVAAMQAASSHNKVAVMATIVPQKEYSAINAAKTSILNNFDVKGLLDKVERSGSCDVLARENPSFVKTLSRLVTGKAVTIQLYP